MTNSIVRKGTAQLPTKITMKIREMGRKKKRFHFRSAHTYRYRPPGSPGSGTIPKWISPGSASYVARPATSFIFVYITTVDPYVVIDLFYLFYF
jgi:hypothetical protein